jgi:hypothetical protein
MILVLDFDRTLNQLYPASVRSIRELAPAVLQAENGRAFWDWIIDHLRRVDYPPYQPAIETVRLLASEASAVVINTGRPEAVRAISTRWIARFLAIDEIWMRADSDFRPTAEVKRDNLRAILRSNPGQETFAFDDNRNVLSAYREEGVHGLHAPECWSRLRSSILARGAQESVAAVLKRHL